MTQFTDKDELETLKAQMKVLKNHLSNDEVINKEVLDATFQAQVKQHTHRAATYLIGIAVGIGIALIFLAMHYLKGMYSTGFTMASVLWGLLWAVVGYCHYKQDTQEKLLAGNLVDQVSKVLNWKKENQTYGLIALVALAIWIPCLLVETWGDLSTNLDHAVIVFIILGFVLITNFTKYRKTQRAINQILKQIEELKKD